MRFPLLLFLLAGAAACGDDAPVTLPEGNPLLEPGAAREDPPETFRIRFETTKGDFVVEAHRAWAPDGAKRLYNLVKIGFFEDVAFFRVLPRFVAQFGVHGDPAVNREWRGARIADDPAKESNRRGTVTFATAGPNSRTTQLFVNLKDNASLDAKGFTPVGEVVEGMEVVDSLYSGYRGTVDQIKARRQGNAYLKESFPKLDYVKRATLE